MTPDDVHLIRLAGQHRRRGPWWQDLIPRRRGRHAKARQGIDVIPGIPPPRVTSTPPPDFDD